MQGGLIFIGFSTISLNGFMPNHNIYTIGLKSLSVNVPENQNLEKGLV